MEPIKDGKQGSGLSQHQQDEFLGLPVYRRVTSQSSSPSFSLEPSETYRSLGSEMGRPALIKGGSWGQGGEVDFVASSKAAGAAAGSKEDSLSSVTKRLDVLDFFASSSSQPKIQSQPVKDCPIYYEPNSSFFAKTSPSAIFDSMIAQLKKQNITYEFDQLKNKIKAEMVSAYDSDLCTFRIHLFKAPDTTGANAKKAKFLVEVQRRCGCCVAFRGFYQSFLQGLAAEGIAIPFSAASAHV